MKISVIVATYNRNKVLCESITSILGDFQHLSEDVEKELIIVDQSSKHDEYTNKFLKSVCSENVILINEHLASLPNARNVGIKISSGDIIIFLDDDILVQKNFFNAYLKAYSENDVYSVVGNVLLVNKDKDNIILSNQSSFKSYIKKKLIFFVFGNKSYVISKYGLVLSDTSSNKRQIVDGGMGCNMSFRKCVFDQVGYFDTNYIGNALREETDLFYRMKSRNMKILFEPKASLLHLMDNTGGCRSEESQKYWNTYFYNQFYFYIKNYGFGKIKIKMLVAFDIYSCRKRNMDIDSIIDIAYNRALNVIKNIN